MSINLKLPDVAELKPRITIFGVGGAGGNAVNNMITSKLEGVEFVVANTDAQALAQSGAPRKVQMGAALTEGLGAGSQPQIGAAAAEEALPEIIDHLSGSHMVFITAGMGGGTGTGAAPVIARASREQGILTVAVVTKPFHFEGQRRMAIAEQGIENLSHHVDTLIVIPNQNLFRVANEKTTFADAFAMADQVLHSGVAGITDLMVKEGLINLDFADVRTVMNEMGKAMMGTGEASGDKRAVDAAEAAISNPLLDDVSMKGARGLLISISGGRDLTLYEVDEAASRIREEVDPEANIILGATFDDTLEGTMRVSVVATGIEIESEMGGWDQIDYEHTAVEGAYYSDPEDDAGYAHQPEALPQMIEEEMPAPAPAPDYLVEAEPMQPDAYQSAEQPMDRPEQYYGTDQALAEMPRAMDEGAYETEAVPPELADVLGVQPEAEAAAEYEREPQPIAETSPRMPDVEDFPPIAQREIQAQAQAEEEIGARAQTKKAGFFERLASVGLGKRDPETVAEEMPAASVPQTPAEQPMPQAAPAAAAPQPAAAAPQPAANVEPIGNPQSPQSEHPFLQAVDAGQNIEEDELEIPAFLRRQAN